MKFTATLTALTFVGLAAAQTHVRPPLLLYETDEDDQRYPGMCHHLLDRSCIVRWMHVVVSQSLTRSSRPR